MRLIGIRHLALLAMVACLVCAAGAYAASGLPLSVWEVTPGEFHGGNAGFGEHMHVLCGEGTVTSEDGTTVELRPGVTFVAPAGWRGRWEVRQTVRKIYVIWTMP